MPNDTWLSDFQSRMQEVQQKAAKLTEGLAAASATKSSTDGAVTVTVGANGSLTNLELGRQASELTPQRLAALIMRTVRDAQRSASAKVGEALQEFGDDGAILQQYANFPPPAEPSETPDARREPPDDFARPPESDPGPAPSAPPPLKPPPPPDPPAAPTRPARPRPPHDDDAGDLNPW